MHTKQLASKVARSKIGHLIEKVRPKSAEPPTGPSTGTLSPGLRGKVRDFKKRY